MFSRRKRRASQCAWRYPRSEREISWCPQRRCSRFHSVPPCRTSQRRQTRGSFGSRRLSRSLSTLLLVALISDMAFSPDYKKFIKTKRFGDIVSLLRKEGHDEA